MEQAHHIVLTTHNSRTSQRMIKYKVRKGPARELDLKEEIILTSIIATIVQENQYRCISYNICRDHVHMILLCSDIELTLIIQKLKSISSKLFHRHPEVSKSTTALHKNKLWSQKFFYVSLNEFNLATLSRIPGAIYHSSHLTNAINYINRNREKHKLPESIALQRIIDKFVMDIDKAYGTAL